MRLGARLGRAALVAGSLCTLIACAGDSAKAPLPAGHPPPHPGFVREPQPNEPLLARVRQLTFAGRRSGEGYFGPEHGGTTYGGAEQAGADGAGTLVFQSEREPGNPFYQIYRMNLASGELERVSPGVGKATCGWIHPDGRKVLFASTHLDSEAPAKQAAEFAERESGKLRRYAWDYDPNYDLFASDPGAGRVDATSAPRQLTSEWGYDAEGSWSPGGRRIAWASNRHAYANELSAVDQERLSVDPAYFMEIYLSDGEGGSPRRLTHTPGYDGGPFFSPDGESIVWRRFSEDGATAEIYTMQLGNDAIGEQIHQLTHLDAMSWAPFYHPSGDYIVFATNLQGFANFELYLVDAQGRHDPVRVTHRKGFDGLPSFSPDGETISWTSGRTGDGKSQIFLADWDDAAARRSLGLSATQSREIEALFPVPTLYPDIQLEDLRAHVAALASEDTAGRLTGTEGERIATAYAARVFRSLGLDPAGDDGDYFQHFDFVAGVSLGENNTLHVLGESVAAEDFEVDRDWRPLAFSRDGVADAAQVVFAGYGIVAPASDHTPALDAYAELDVADKWVLVFRFVPEGLSPPARQHLRRHSSLRYKAMLARDRGARGILIVSGPRSKARRELVKLAFDTSLGGSSLSAISISDALAKRLLRQSGRDLAELQDEFDGAQGASTGFVLEGVRVEARVDLRKQRRTGRNVLARLPANAGPADSHDSPAPALLIGAHIDHLGRGEGQGSLARGDERDRIHPGADDNASGVAVLLEAAQDLASRSARGELLLQRDVIFAAWSGEELGLLGSSHFVDALSDPHDPHDPHALLSSRIAAYINLDMVGRLRDELLVYGVASSSAWPRLIEKSDAALGVPVVAKADSFLPSDSTPFAARGVPTLSAFTGVHAEYHSPRDTPETLDYDGMLEVARLVTSLSEGIAAQRDPPDYIPQKRPSPIGASSGFRAYLGTIPDYAASEVDGLMLSGVVSGGPASQAGLRSGDVVVELAGRRIENIYDYTYALEALEIGVEVDISVLRDGERRTLTILPASRE